MSFTKVAPAGIGTEPGNSILIGDSLLHSTGIDIGSNTGIGVTIRKHGDATFTGIITASAFFGDGSGLEGVSSSGIGTPLSDDDTSDLNKIYYVNQELSIGSTITVNHPSSAVASYTHYQDLVVTDDADFIVSDGDTFIPDVLGIRTSTSTTSAATGGRIRAGTITNAGANGAPNFPNGLTGTAGTFTGNLNVGGVLTYEDVTNVDSVGLITARAGVNLTGGVINSAGNINCTSGRFQRGSATVQDGDAIAGGININGLDMDASVIMSVFGNDGDFTRISGSKSRNASVGSHTIVQNNDVLLSLKGFGSDGTNFEEAAQIEMQVDGSPGNNVMPGRILFKTTATDGVVERLRIGSAGQLGIGGANYGTSGQVLTSQGSGSAVQWATPSSGLSYAQQWHLTSNANLTANTDNVLPTDAGTWEKQSQATNHAGSVGSDMSYSSGVFTFPATGIWKIEFYGYWGISASDSDHNLRSRIQTTTNGGSSFATTQETAMSIKSDSTYTYQGFFQTFIFDVTSTSDRKCRFVLNPSGSNCYYKASNNPPETGALFMRLGDT